MKTQIKMRKKTTTRKQVNKATEKQVNKATEEQVKTEAARCLKCGAAWVDSNICIGCGLCTTRCKFDAIHLHREYDAWGVPYEKLVGHVLATTAQRVGRRIVKKDI